MKSYPTAMRLGGGILLITLFVLSAWLSMRPRAAAPVGGSALEGERCPVCGMFVAPHAAWVCQLQFQDGHAVYFDGVKDLLKCCRKVETYLPGYTAEDIRGIEVTDYYSLRSIVAGRAWFVSGSDVLGPMGAEWIPFETEGAARDFLRDHHGQRLWTFDQLTRERLLCPELCTPDAAVSDPDIPDKATL